LDPGGAVTPLGHFTLHEVHGFLRARWLQCVEENRRGDVVRDVSHDQVIAAAQRAQIGLQHVGLDDANASIPCVSFAQDRG
jgi:hypothetical protein